IGRSGKEAGLTPDLLPSEPDWIVSQSSGSSRCKAPLRDAGFHDGFGAQEARDLRVHSLEDRTFLEVGAPPWIERIGVRFDLQMPPDSDVRGVDERPPRGLSL